MTDEPLINKPPIFPAVSILTFGYRPETGEIVATPGVSAALRSNVLGAADLLDRHLVGTWNCARASPEDRAAQASAARNGRIFSCHTLDDETRLWIVTERDRSATTLLLPADYARLGFFVGLEPTQAEMLQIKHGLPEPRERFQPPRP